MKVIVKPHKIKIELEHDYNSGEYNVQECNFEFSDEYTGLSKVVIFSNSNVTKKIQIYNDRCIVPAEVLQNEGVVGIGVYGYEVSGDELTLRYSPKPQCFPVEKGSYAEGTQPAPPTPSVVEQLQQQITNNANNISSLQDLTASQGEQIETNTNDISAIKSEQTTQNNKIQANTEEIESINGIIPTLAKKTEIPTKVSQLENDSNYVTETEMSNAIYEEKTERENADIELQSQIDAITVSSDVVDVVGTYQELLDYDTSKLTDDDIIKVLVDSTHNDALSYYRWQITGGIGSWQYVGSEGPFYTKNETNSLLNEKQDEITNENKLGSDLVSDNGQTNKFVTTQEKTAWNNKQDALTFDNTPTKNSNNPVKSGGIYDFVNTKLEDYVLETDFEESQSLQDEEIARNKMVYNALPKVSGEGTYLTLNNTAECPVYEVGLRPSELEQETTSGKNLALPTWAEDFVTAVNDNTRAKLETKDSRNCLWYIPQAGYGYYPTMNFTLGITFKENTQYTISFDILKETYNNRTIGIYYTDGTWTTNTNVTSIDTWEHHSITSTAGKTIAYICPYYTAGNTYIDINTWQIEEGTTETSYEKPTYGASPNPQYPQEIHTVSGENSVVVGNKNLLDTSYLVEANADKSLVNLGFWAFKLSEELTTFTLSRENNTMYSDGRYLAIGQGTDLATANNNKVWLMHPSLQNLNNKSRTLTNTGELWLFTGTNSTYISDMLNRAGYLQLEKGSTATTYVPHQEQTYPISLGDLEYCKIGDYEDEFYKATESDTGLTAGKWYLKKNIGKVVLNGSENWVSYTDLGTNARMYYQLQNIVLRSSGYSNYFKIINIWGTDETSICLTPYQQSLIAIKLPKAILQTENLQGMKDWLSTHNTEVYYQSTTPTYTLLSNTLQNQLEAIWRANSYEEQTNISQENNDLPFVIKMSAIRDLSGIFELIQ